MTIGQIHFINLDQSADRLTKFRRVNSHIDTIRVLASDGSRLDRAQLFREGIITNDLSYPPGSLGCAISHINLWKVAISGDRNITICEDDSIFAKNFYDQSASVCSTLPQDWDLIQWGYDFDPKYVWINLGLVKAKLEFYDRKSASDSAEFHSSNRVAVMLAHSFGLQCYSLSPRGAKILLNTCLPLRDRIISFPSTNVIIKNLGIDCIMNDAYSKMKAYVCIPPLIIHDIAQKSDRITLDETQ